MKPVTKALHPCRLALILGLAGLVPAVPTFAASVASTLDSGGGSAGSATYAIEANVGLIGGLAGGGPVTNLSGGVLIQPSTAKSLAVSAAAPSLAEGGSTQLAGLAVMEDDSISLLSGADIAWGACAFPIVSIANSGLLTTAAVWTNTPGLFSGRYRGAAGSSSLLVVDSNPDNYGRYADDGLPDWWQVQYFGLDNPAAAPAADADGTGQNNLFKYVAGLNPTNPASRFELRLSSVAHRPSLTFSPRYPDRTYEVQYRTNPASSAFSTLNGGLVNDVGTERTVTDLNATNAARFYRVRITLP